jgi:beta-mannosidase
MLLWDEFFQPNPSDGPNPANITLYLANVREKILRFRNHASIAVWCARNEGFPPKNIDDSLRLIMNELEPVRLYQASSTDGRGVNSGGPYFWRRPDKYYDFGEAFKTEIGSMSVPTIESIHGMMPQKDWEEINDDWAEHDFANGAQSGNDYRKIIGERYGKVINLADFVRKAQLANYEAFRAMYEGRDAKLFKPSTGVITWMSNPAQPSFVWQLYHHDLEPNASLFAVESACEPVHVQLNEKTGRIQVINNLGTELADAKIKATVYDLNGTLLRNETYAVTAAASQATDIGLLRLPAAHSPVYFVKLNLTDSSGTLISRNFYWRAAADHPDNLQSLNDLPLVTLKIKTSKRDQGDSCILKVTIQNSTTHLALMVHLQLRQQVSDLRVLPVFYSENYVSLVPGETRFITIEAAKKDLKGENPSLMVDGWNIAVVPAKSGDVKVLLNEDAQVSSWPETGLPLRSGH